MIALLTSHPLFVKPSLCVCGLLLMNLIQTNQYTRVLDKHSRIEDRAVFYVSKNRHYLSILMCLVAIHFASRFSFFLFGTIKLSPTTRATIIFHNKMSTLGADRLFSNSSKLPFSFRVSSDDVMEVLFIKVRPEFRGEVQLGVGGLPEQEVREPAVAARAHQHRRVRQAQRARPRRPRQGLFCDGRRTTWQRS